jgi:death on curing protein
MEIIYLSVEQVIEMHSEAIRRYGGADGLRSQDLLESAVFQPQQSAFREDAYPTIPQKAAAYGFFLAQNQAFIDGNKRAAADCMLAFLYINGYEPDLSDDELAAGFIALGTKEMSKEQFFVWLIEHVSESIG